MNQSIQTEIIIGDNVLIKAIETRQLGSKQDYCQQGTYTNEKGETVQWIAAFDGHGGDETIRVIRNANLDEIMTGNLPHINLQKEILANTMSYISGATMVLVKATFSEEYTEIEFTNIGDSTGILYVNDEPVFVTKEHNYENGEEIVRLITEGRVDAKMPIVKSSGGSIDIFSRDTLYSKKGTYINFVLPDGNNMELSPSQSLGHLDICGLKPTIKRLRLKKTDIFKVCAFSDGITDVMPVNGVASPIWLKFMAMSTAKEIVDTAETQWKREWTVCQSVGNSDYEAYQDFTRLRKTKFPRNGYDDCCCAVMEFRPRVIEVVPPSSMNCLSPPPPPPLTKKLEEENFDNLYS